MSAEEVSTATPATNGSSTNGSSTGTQPRRAPLMPPRKVSMGPAMVVLGLALFILVLFGVMSLLSTGGTTTSAPTKNAGHVAGTSLHAVAAAHALKPIEVDGAPPANILGALVLPAGAVPHGAKDNTTSAGQYDEQMRFSLSTSQTTVVNFFHRELKAKGWTIESVGPATGVKNGVEVLAQKAGDDGWYWAAGAVVSPTTFALDKGPQAESTAFTLRLFQESDEE